jgi:LmbE family N-acetylglucosaminyl deacetylase
MRKTLESLLARDDGYWPRVITDLSARHVLVLAPHMDDEILGCGGILHKHALAGALVSVVYLTDGRKGGNPEIYQQGLTKAAIADLEEALVVQRKEEAKRAASIIGIQRQIFLDAIDGSLRVSAGLIERLRNILRAEHPDVIYLPSILDLHPDHQVTNRLLYAAMQDLSMNRNRLPLCREYEVWTPLLSNRIIDISEVIDVKSKAIEQFKSQLAQTNYLRTQLALNAYRSLYYGRGFGYAEAFFESNMEQFQILHCALSKRVMNIPY